MKFIFDVESRPELYKALQEQALRLGVIDGSDILRWTPDLNANGLATAAFTVEAALLFPSPFMIQSATILILSV